MKIKTVIYHFTNLSGQYVEDFVARAVILGVSAHVLRSDLFSV